MVEATLSRAATAHTDGDLTNGLPDGDLTRETTGGVDGRLAADEVEA